MYDERESRLDLAGAEICVLLNEKDRRDHLDMRVRFEHQILDESLKNGKGYESKGMQ